MLEALDCLRAAVTLFDSRERLSYSNTHYNYLLRSLPPFKSLIGATYEQLIRLEIAGGEIAEPDSLDPDLFVERRLAQLRERSYRPFDIALADGRVIELKSRHTRDGGWIVLWSDATHSRNLLSRLEDAIDLSADAFAFWSRDDRLALCNGAYAEMHGVVPAEIANASFEDVVRAAVRRGRFEIGGRAEAWVERRLEAHRAPAGALTVTTVDGTAYLVRERATRDGGSVTVFTDVTERRRAETALAEQTRGLQRTKRALQKSKSEVRQRTTYLADLTQRLDAAEAEADTAKTTLLRTMSHELKTPLNAIIGFADLLKSSPGRFRTEQVGEYAGLIHGAGGNLLKLINQILDLTKIAAGRFTLWRESVSVRAAIAAALDNLGARAAAKSIAVSVEGECADDCAADADETALVNMISHLVENAIAYTQAGGTVCIGVEREPDYVRIRIADNGPGVAAADLPRIMQPFEQAGRGTCDHNHGAGLGLPIVKALVELHGGTLSLESELGHGLTATLELPAARAGGRSP